MYIAFQILHSKALLVRNFSKCIHIIHIFHWITSQELIFKLAKKFNIWNWGWISFWQSFKNWFHYRDIFYSNIIENQNFSTFWMLFLYSKHVLKNTATVVWKFMKNKNVSIGDLYASNHLYWRWNFDKTER